MSKFKVGDKVRVVVDKTAGYPNHEMHIHDDMLKKGSTGVIDAISPRDWGTAYYLNGWFYAESWLELVEDEPAKPSHGFKIGDYVEFVGSRIEYPKAPVGKVVVSDLTDKYMYVDGFLRESAKGWDFKQFKKVEPPEVPKPNSPVEFKVGDKVRCIDDSGQRTVNVGCVYLVRDVNVVGYLLLKECGGSYMPQRFELVEAAEEEPSIGNITIGCVVEWVDKDYPSKVGKLHAVSDIDVVDGILYLDGDKAGMSSEGWFAKRFKLVYKPGQNPVDKVAVNPVDYGITLDHLTDACSYSIELVNSNTTLGEHDMSIDTTVAVQNKTYIFGQDADTVTVDTIFNHITRLEAEVAKYDSIKAKPKAIKAKVDALKAEIEALVKFSDEKFATE